MAQPTGWEDDDDTEDLIDVLEAARLAGRSAETIRRWIWGGRLPSQREGNRHVVRKDDVFALSSTADASNTTLADWLKMVGHETGDSSQGSAQSAADLVLKDRRLRSMGESS